MTAADGVQQIEFWVVIGVQCTWTSTDGQFWGAEHRGQQQMGAMHRDSGCLAVLGVAVALGDFLHVRSAGWTSKRVARLISALMQPCKDR